MAGAVCLAGTEGPQSGMGSGMQLGGALILIRVGFFLLTCLLGSFPWAAAN